MLNTTYTKAGFEAAVTNGASAKWLIYATGAYHAHVATWEAARTDLKRSCVAINGGKPSRPTEPSGADEQLIAIAKKVHESGAIDKAIKKLGKTLEGMPLYEAVCKLVASDLQKRHVTHQRAYIELVKGKTLEEVTSEQEAKAAARNAAKAQGEDAPHTPATLAQQETDTVAMPLPELVTAISNDVYAILAKGSEAHDAVTQAEFALEVKRLFDILDSAEIRSMVDAITAIATPKKGKKVA